VSALAIIHLALDQQKGHQVVIERNYLVAGVRGQPAIVKVSI
jgi:hypothetical protein